MSATVLVMVVSIYVGAVAGPLAVLVAARRTGHGPAWRFAIGVCATIIWLTLFLGILQEAFGLSRLSDFLEGFGILAVIAFAVLAVIALVIAVRPWPAVAVAGTSGAAEGKERGFRAEIRG